MFWLYSMPVRRSGLRLLWAVWLACALALSSAARTQEVDAPSPQASSNPPAAAPDAGSGGIETVFPHTQTGRYWISGQVNIITQGHGAFSARYSGPHSLTNWGQSATTQVITLYTGYQLTPTTEVFANVESATGNGIGHGNGLAGFSNLDSVRAVQGVALSTAPYLARLMLRQIVPLGGDRQDAERDEFHLAASLPARRLEFRVGKMSAADYFDVNSYGADSHLQFMNWTVDNNGAFDYAANTRGYTDGAIVEYDDHWFAARFAAMLMPKVANGVNLDANLSRSRELNLELEARGNRIAGKPGVVRLLGYVNQGVLGSYRQAVDAFLGNQTTAPNIIATREQGRHRFGFGLNAEQQIAGGVSLFGRLGWSDGHNEAFCYTEVDRTAEIGAFSMGSRWHRRSDRAGVAFVANGIVPLHRQYLALGGMGFLLGDGALTYGSERIFEGFYTAHLWRGFFASYDFQHVNNPGYNQDRGPVAISSVRFHTDF